ncbi:MAG: DUF2207 domain-containing protein [Terriglobales bacterium]
MRVFRTQLLIATLLLACAARAQQGNSYNLVLSVEHDGSAIVSEQLALSSPLREPLHWRIPTAITGPLGIRRLLFVDILEISDVDGNVLTSKTRRFGDALEVVVPVQPVAGDTVRISYDVRNAVRFGDSADEFLWPLAQRWSEPFMNVAADVSVPAGAAGQLSAQLLRIDSGNRIALPLPLSGSRGAWGIESRNPNRTLLDLVFAPGVLRQPSLLLRAVWFLRANPVVLFPVLLLIVVLLFRKYSAHRAAGPVVTRYDPPADLPPAEAGVLIDDRLDPRDLAAMLLDLARRGFIRIEPGSPDEGVPYLAPDFVLRLLKPMDHWKGAYPYEHVVLFHTFYGGHWTKLSSVSLRFYAVVPSVSQMIRDELLRKGLYVAPWKVAVQRTLAVVAVVAAFAFAQVAGWFAVVQSGTVAVIAAVSMAIVLPLLLRGITHRTSRGDAVFAQLRGFEEFMNTVEADRMERITPGLFESFLPYAVALGVEHRWGATFSTISSGPPLWWDKANSGGVPDFVRLVGNFSIPTRRAPAAPKSVVKSGGAPP